MATASGILGLIQNRPTQEMSHGRGTKASDLTRHSINFDMKFQSVLASQQQQQQLSSQNSIDGGVEEADSHLTGQWSDLWESRLHQCKFSCSLLSFLFSPFFSPVARETRGHLLYASSTLTNTSCILSNCDLTSFVPQHPTIWRTTRILWAKSCRYTQVTRGQSAVSLSPTRNTSSSVPARTGPSNSGC
jgi:hypothetical protein